MRMHPRHVHHSAVLPDKKPLLSVPNQLALSVLWFALNFQNAALLPIVVPTQILLFTGSGQVGNAQQATLLGWLSALGSVVAMLVAPITGALSDHTRGALGRRRPYIIVASAIFLPGVVLLATARDIAAFAIGFFVYQVASSACTAAYQSLLPDRVPREQRGAASGYLGLMTILGNVGSLALAGILLSSVSLTSIGSLSIERGANVFYALTSVALLVSVFITLVGVPDEPLTLTPSAAAGSAAETGTRQRFAHLWIAPWRHNNFTWVFLTRAFVMLGLTLFLTFIEYYFANVAHETNFVGATATLAVLALLGAVCSAFLLGVLSDRVARVPLVLLASACMAIPAVAFILLPAGVPLWPLGLLFGLGYGAYTSVDWALAVDALPSASDVGKDMGIWSVATTLPAVVAPLLGSLVLALASRFGAISVGYRLVFALAAIFLLLGAICVRFVREDRGAPPLAPSTLSVPGARRRRIARGWSLAFRTRAGRARGFLRFWPVWERITLLVHPTHPIPHASANVLRTQLTRWRGRPITLPDGTQVARGDLVVELHVNNRALGDVLAHASDWRLLPLIADDLRALVGAVGTPVFPREVRAVYGFTLLSRAAPRLGFTVRSRPHTLRAWLDRVFLMGLLPLYNPRGLDRLEQGTIYTSYPAEVWMSCDELLRRYGDVGYARAE
jgi:MFS family permease